MKDYAIMSLFVFVRTLYRKRSQGQTALDNNSQSPNIL